VTVPFKGKINQDIRDSVEDWAPFIAPEAPQGAPNVVYIVVDDVGFSAMSCYGGPIQTPNIDRIAANGLRYTQWHTVALCSPTRSCLLTGRNHTRNSMACITEGASGFPNASGTIPPQNGMLSEILGEQGWNTYMVGKWHLCPTVEMNLASTRRNWPTGRGFERWYGFLGAETSQWYPELIYDNHPVEQPRTPEEGYHFSEDITDKAIEFIMDSKAVAPNKPFMLYYSFGAAHAPHHAPREWIEKYKGQFDQGYEAMRAETLARQKRMGIVPQDTELPPVNPIGTPQTHTDPAKPMSDLDTTRPWASLSADEKRLFCRMAEVYAGFLGHVDHHIGRLLDYLEETGQRDNTLVILVSDNGASGEGGPNGSVNENKMANSIPDDIAENLAKIDDLGGPKTYNHYPTGWAMAFNTPFKMWKRYEFNGGTSDPCLMSWPKRMKARGQIRHNYHHAIDVVPTILDVLGIEAP
jgi:arylsulfatase A-like enzyme